MKFRYLMSVAPEMATDPDYWSPGNEPVVPWFPTTGENVFLGIDSLKKSLMATVQEIDGDPDIFVDRLATTYPGLPRRLLTNYVWSTHLAANRHKPGDTFRIFIDQNSAKLQKTGEVGYDILWEEQPV